MLVKNTLAVAVFVRMLLLIAGVYEACVYVVYMLGRATALRIVYVNCILIASAILGMHVISGTNSAVGRSVASVR